MKRRNFLKGMASLPLLSSVSATNLLADNAKTTLVKNGKVLTAAHWGIMDVEIKDGKVVGSKSHIQYPEFVNPLPQNTADMVYKSRVKYPMVRKSYLENPDSPKPELRGKDEWVRVSYEDAIKLVARELKKTRAQKGIRGVFAGAEGWRSTGNVHNSTSWLHRFMNLSGGFVKSLEDYSTAAGQVILPHVLGSIEVYEQQTSHSLVLENSKVILIWGADPLATLRVAFSSNEERGLKFFEDLKKQKDKKIIIVDPIKSYTGQFFDGIAEWITPIPNTDTAMMLGMAYHLYKTEKYDKEFIKTYTTGFDKFLPYLLGETDKTPKTPEWAAKICGIEAKVIKELAEVCVQNRTMIMAGWAMQRAHHGEQPYWMIATLASMIGQIGLPGGGIGFSYHYANGGSPTCKGAVLQGVNRASVGAFNDNGDFIGTATGRMENGKFVVGQGVDGFKEPQGYGIPTSRIADALLKRGEKFQHNGKELTYPDIDFIYWAGGNPFVHHQDLNLFKKAWQSVRTVVINEQYWTPTAKMADIVFPITTPYERNDITMSGDYSNMHIVPMKQVVEKQFEAKDDYQIFTDLCKAYAKDLVVAFTDNGKDEFDWIRYFYESARAQIKESPEIYELMKPFDEFWAENKLIEFAPTMESKEWVRHGEFREDPILNPLGTPSGLIEIYSETIANMGYDDCKAHPMWFEPVEWLGMKDRPASMHMLSPHPEYRLHSQLNQTSLRDKYAVANREPIWINSEDAKEKGIKDGDIVRVFNARGEILAGAVVTQNISRNVVRLCEGGWYDPDENGLCKNGCPNVLTIDLSTSKLANGPIPDTTLVNVEKFKGKIPELTAFKEPKFA
ncbi:molybdopterin-dependent oxidoreductase [Campylobacter sp. 9BO]|uniref:molybdopterin-dependent oxidoreductase n=1 Tax=Campylobacter sp. 9BO TaxID=3424759 RepID=UPI003D33FCCE